MTAIKSFENLSKLKYLRTTEAN